MDFPKPEVLPAFAFAEVASGWFQPPALGLAQGTRDLGSSFVSGHITPFPESLFFSAVGGGIVTESCCENGSGMNVQACFSSPRASPVLTLPCFSASRVPCLTMPFSVPTVEALRGRELCLLFS